MENAAGSVEEPEPATHKEAMASSHAAEWRIAEQGGKTDAAAAASVKTWTFGADLSSRGSYGDRTQVRYHHQGDGDG